MENDTNHFGNIYVSHRAIARIAYQAVVETYGIVGLAPKNLARGLARALIKDPTMGVDVQFDGKSITIDLYIIVEYGTRIKTVAATVAESVKYLVETTLDMPVNTVNVHVRGLRISSTD